MSCVCVLQLQVTDVSVQPQLAHDHQKERDDHKKPLSHKQLQQRQEPATGPTTHTASSGTLQHEQLHKQLHRQSSSDTNLTNPQVLNPSAVLHDYINLSPAQPGPPKSGGAAQSLVDEIHSSKRPIPTPRMASMDAGRGGPLPPTHQTPHSTTTSMPEPQLTHTTELDQQQTEHDIHVSQMTDVDIHNEAAEVVAIGSDEQNTIPTMPFDPFLECLYCNQKFRYGEIQKYRKHVNNCSESAIYS